MTRSADTIRLEGMQFYGYHGVFPEERKLGQRFGVDVALTMDLSQAAASDDLRKTVNYAEAAEIIRDIVENTSSQLLEHLAGVIATRLLTHYTKVTEAVVRITKPHPPIPIQMTGVSVEIRRSRGEA